MSVMTNEMGIISFGESRSLSGCLDKKSAIFMSSPFQYFTTNEYSLRCSISFLILRVGGSDFALRMWTNAEWSTYTVKLYF